ncbi:MAG: P-loop ATPase [Candidatus Nealsonbacteria bacterium]|nr:MAG: P-loop ATPase [Candidatus Nealsonbacteria bacterium]
MKIVIASGKGGVGKSMLVSTLAMLFAKNQKVVAVDCDADAPNLAIWLGEPENWKEVKKISVSEKPIINQNKLTKKEAKQCVKKCRFNALLFTAQGKLKLNPFFCEGCGACEVFCPKGVVKMKPVKNGEIRTKNTKYNFPLVSGQLFPGETGSGKMVDQIKAEAEKFNHDLMLIDSAPGTGCPVIASLRGSNFVVLVIEPTPSGFSDLKRVLKVVNHFNFPWGLVINKWDINKELSNRMEKWSGNKFIGKISYDKQIFKAIANLKPILETNLKVKTEITTIYNKLKNNFEF